jgi:biotin carboxyl carrier protein
MSFLILEPHGRLPEEGNPILEYLMQFSFFSTLFIIIAVVVFVFMTYALIKIIIDPINKNTREFNLSLKNYSPKNPNDSQRNTIIKVASPMTGVIYFSPAPNKPNYVIVGQKITKGDKLCLIEAVKTFNEITSEASGTLVKILVKEGQQVEFGQDIFEIKSN